MTPPQFPGWLLPALLLAAGCASSPLATGHGMFFSSVPLSATQVQIDFYAGDLPARQGALAALCRCAELALGSGFGYLRVYDRERLGAGAARWKLELFHLPPVGAVLLDPAAPTWDGDPPVDGVLDAGSFATACGRRSSLA